MAKGQAAGKRRFLSLVLSILLVLIGGTVARAQSANIDWTVSQVRGTVLQLVNAEWHEVQPGDQLVSLNGLRTLKGATLQLLWRKAVLDLGPETAVAFELSEDSSPLLTVSQYAGSIQVSVSAGEEIVVRTASLTVASNEGRFSVVVSSAGTQTAVAAGSASIANPSTGYSANLFAGEAAETNGTSVVGSAIVHGNGRNNGNTGNGQGNNSDGNQSGNNGNGKGGTGNGQGGNNGNGKSKGQNK